MEPLFEQIAFWVLAVITIFSALKVATMNNLSRAAVYLVFFFLGGSGLYFLLRAEFLALMQVMVYAGAVSVLFAFVIMMTPMKPETNVKQSINRWAGALLSCLFLVFIVAAILGASAFKEVTTLSVSQSLEELGTLLLSKFLVPFELVSILLLVALIAAILYTNNRSPKEEEPHESD